MNIYLIILKFYASTRVVKNYSTPIWSRVLELLGTALLRCLICRELKMSSVTVNIYSPLEKYDNLPNVDSQLDDRSCSVSRRQTVLLSLSVYLSVANLPACLSV